MAVEFYKEFGELGYLANYSDHGFYKDGVFYKTVEHYYQSEKFDNLDIKKRIIECDTPKEASIIGRDRNNIRRDKFTDIKVDVMKEGVYLKFSQNKDIRSKIIETGREEIRELSVKESFWGVGPKKNGDNFIGKILMDVRCMVKTDLIEDVIKKMNGKKVYIIGHSRPDADSVFSSIVLTRILKKLGVNATFAVRDTNFVDKDLINDYLDEDYEVIDNYKNKKFILVDHNNLDGINKEDVVLSIDHHRITGEVLDLIEIEYASCALLIYDLFKDKYSFTRDDKLLIALSVLSDTEYLSSRRFGTYDKKLYNELGFNLDIEYLKKKYLNICDFNLDVVDNLGNDYKEYDYNGTNIMRSLIKSYNREFETYYDNYIKGCINKNINLLIWCDYERFNTYIWYKDKKIKFPYFTTSTYLILDYLKKEEYL